MLILSWASTSTFSTLRTLLKIVGITAAAAADDTITVETLVVVLLVVARGIIRKVLEAAGIGGDGEEHNGIGDDVEVEVGDEVDDVKGDEVDDFNKDEEKEDKVDGEEKLIKGKDVARSVTGSADDEITVDVGTLEFADNCFRCSQNAVKLLQCAGSIISIVDSLTSFFLPGQHFMGMEQHNLFSGFPDKSKTVNVSKLSLYSYIFMVHSILLILLVYFLIDYTFSVE